MSLVRETQNCMSLIKWPELQYIGWDHKGFRNQRAKLSMWSQQGEDKPSLDRPISFPTCLEYLASWTKMLLPFQLCQPVKPRLFLSSNGLIHQPKPLLSTWVTRVTLCDRGRGFTCPNMYGRTALYGLVRSGQCEPLPSHQCLTYSLQS